MLVLLAALGYHRKGRDWVYAGLAMAQYLQWEAQERGQEVAAEIQSVPTT